MRSVGGKKVNIIAPVEAREVMRNIHAKLKEANKGMLKGDILLTALVEYEKKIDRVLKNGRDESND